MTEATATTLRDALKESTRAQHDSIESAMKVSEWSKTKDGYRQVIERFYGFHLSMEAAIWAHEEELREIFPDLANRTRLPLIEKDLRALGDSEEKIAELPVCEDLPDLSTPARAAGALYVLEGSTMGGMMMAKWLQEEHGYTPESGSAYYKAYGDQTMPMWQAFTKGLADERLEANRDEVVEAAGGTFAALENWFRTADIQP